MVIDSLAPKITVTNAPARIYYNPVSYAAPTDRTALVPDTDRDTIRRLTEDIYQRAAEAAE